MVYDYYYCLHTVFFTVYKWFYVLFCVFSWFWFSFGFCCWLCDVCMDHSTPVCLHKCVRRNENHLTLQWMHMKRCLIHPILLYRATSSQLPFLLTGSGVVGSETARIAVKKYYYALQNYGKYLPNVNNAKDYFRVLVYSLSYSSTIADAITIGTMAIIKWLFIFVARSHKYLYVICCIFKHLERNALDAEHLICFSLLVDLHLLTYTMKIWAL